MLNFELHWGRTSKTTLCLAFGKAGFTEGKNPSLGGFEFGFGCCANPADCGLQRLRGNMTGDVFRGAGSESLPEISEQPKILNRVELSKSGFLFRSWMLLQLSSAFFFLSWRTRDLEISKS